MSIGESEKEIELSKWDFPVGIEIEYNTKATKTLQDSIIENIEKVSKYKKGYLLWLNWETAIDDENLRETQEIIGKKENVKLFYLDLLSIPVKTNIKKLS